MASTATSLPEAMSDGSAGTTTQGLEMGARLSGGPVALAFGAAMATKGRQRAGDALARVLSGVGTGL